jgi:hypothetical protein
MRRKLMIAQLLIAETEVKSIAHIGDTEEGYLYDVTMESGKKLKVRVKPGSTIAIQKGDEFVTLDMGVPDDIINLQETSMSDFHEALQSWLTDSRAFREESAAF